MKYSVVVYCSFDAQCPVYLFDTYDKAKEYLHDLWQYSYNDELANSYFPIYEEETYHEDDFAKITWDDGSFMEYILTATSEPMKINGKSYK